MTTVRLAFRDVRDVNFHDRNADGSDAVGKGNGGVCVGPRIHHHSVIKPVGFLQLVDQAALVIRLIIGKLVFGKILFELF